jgi:carbamoyltransferase
LKACNGPKAKVKAFFQRTIGNPRNQDPPIYFRRFTVKNDVEVTHVEHHLAHAASAYYTSGITSKTLIVTCDGIGDGISMAVWRGQNGQIEPLYRVGSEGSLGWFYAAVTEALDWWVGDGEGKTMGLAPYGSYRKTKGVLDKFAPHFRNGKLDEPHDFKRPSGWPQKGAYHWHLPDAGEIKRLVGKFGKADIAAEAQRVLEKELASIIYYWLQKENVCNFCCSGGVFLNVKLNQKVWYSGRVKRHYIFPNAGDSGLALGAALYAYYNTDKETNIDAIDNVYWGPEFSNKDIEKFLKARNLTYDYHEDISSVIAESLANGKIAGWFQGRMESGPRALGNRSILMSPYKAENKDIINSRIKFRESFRPFCPSVITEAAGDYFVKYREEPYMITSFKVVNGIKKKIPAVVHIDDTVRPQTVKKDVNKSYWRLLSHFGALTGYPVLLNTSFNIRGDPIVCRPSQALKCFYDTGLDVLALGNFLIKK